MAQRMNFAVMSGTAIAAALGVASLLGLPGRLAAEIVAERLEAASHHRLHIDGPVGVGFWPSPHFTAETVVYDDAGDPTTAAGFTARRLRLSLAWTSLFAAEPRPSSVELSQPVVRLPLSRSRGEIGADSGAGGPDGARQRGLAAWLDSGRFDHLAVIDGTILLYDAASGGGSRLDHVAIDFSPAAPGRAFGFDGEAVWQGQRLSLVARASAGDKGREIDERAMGRDPLRAADRASEAVPTPAVRDGATAIDVLLQLPGLAPAVTGMAEVRWSGDRFEVENLHGLVGGNRFAARFGLDLSARKPRLDGQVEAESFDIAWPSDHAAPRGTVPASVLAEGAWSDRPWRLEALNYIDADLALRIGRLGSGEVAPAPLAMRATVADGTAKLALTSAERLEAELLVDASGAWPNWRLHGAAHVASLRAPLHRTTGLDGIDGAGVLALALTAAGSSLRDVMASLGGSAAIELRDGVIGGATLMRQFGPLAARVVTGRALEQNHAFAIDRLSAHFVIDHGRARTEDLHLASPFLALDGAGIIDLSAKLFDLSFDPKVGRAIETPIDMAEALAFDHPFTLHGRWSAPMLGPDDETATPRPNRLVFDRHLPEVSVVPVPRGLQRIEFTPDELAAR